MLMNGSLSGTTNMLPNQINHEQLTRYYRTRGAGYWQIEIVKEKYDELDPALRTPMDDFLFRTILYALENGARQKQINVDMLARSGYSGAEAYSIQKYVTKDHSRNEKFTYENDQFVHTTAAYVRKINMTKELFDICTALRNINRISHWWNKK